MNISSGGTSPSNQTQPPHVFWSNCSAYVPPIVQPLNWSSYCDTLELCYTTCNINKLVCDNAFDKNLTNSCLSLPAAERSVCRSVAKEWAAYVNNRTVLADYYTVQNESCSCDSAGDHDDVIDGAWLDPSSHLKPAHRPASSSGVMSWLKSAWTWVWS